LFILITLFDACAYAWVAPENLQHLQQVPFAAILCREMAGIAGIAGLGSY
jgi:hypothetical protein